METIYLRQQSDLEALSIPNIVLALGYFDGVHRGHQKVIRTARELAAKKGTAVAAMTFHPHPKTVLSPHIREESVRYITPLPLKEQLLEQERMDYLFIVQFNQAFATLEPQEFIDDYVLALQAVHVVAGFDFTYGNRGSGTMETLPYHLGDRAGSTTVEKVCENGKKISATQIRSDLESGRVQDANELLGRCYTIAGTVGEGEKRGRTIGFPTANIYADPLYLLPASGVYAVQMKVKGKWHDGVANIGYKPTFHEDKTEEPAVEVHLFDFEDDIYGEPATVQWHHFIRGEKKFSSAEELIKQINKDKETAYRLLKSGQI
ncbi:riboflavin biosynthesis protein RibF [Bacillus piscicola]|uniref:riboflavin biosynthesis protein RibF n=1 Tax=Bacillus piscicola TaxID=1632684 RepID=UPI001F08D366